MRRAIAVAGALLLAVARPALSHQVDEYVQAATISVAKERVQIFLRMTPGVDVFHVVRAAIDEDGDGVFSAAEEQRYAERVLGDLSLAIDGVRLPLRLVSWSFAPAPDLREGRGTIQLAFDAAVQAGRAERRLAFENHHERGIAAYLVNGLVPDDPSIRLGAQRRDSTQAKYELDYTQSAALRSPGTSDWTMRLAWLGAAILLSAGGLALVRRQAGDAA